MTTVNPCRCLRTGDLIEIPLGQATIHFLYDKNGQQHFDLPFRLIDHIKATVKTKTISDTIKGVIYVPRGKFKS